MLKKFAKLCTPGLSRVAKPGSAIARFPKARDGVAAVEFALLAPLLLVLMLGSMEVTHSLWASGKVNQSTDTVNDLIARTATMDNSEFDNLLNAGPLILEPYPQGDLTLTVTSVIGCLQDPDDADSDMTYYVLWSRNWTNDTAGTSPHSNDSAFTRQPDSLKIGDGETLMITEGSYTYHPRIARKIGQTIPMDSIAFNKPRDTDRVRYASLEETPERNCNYYRSGS